MQEVKEHIANPALNKVEGKLIPQLRFKEFDGDISRSKLGEVSTIRTGPFGSMLHQEDYVDEGTPIITVEHLSEQGIVHENLPLVSDSDKLRLKSYTLAVDDIVFSRVGSVDRNSIISEKENNWLFSGRLLRIRTDKEIIESSYLGYYFQLELTKHRIRSVAVGQTMPSLNTQILKSFDIEFPSSLPEQQKIASFLSAVDEKVQQLSKKKELLKVYKKGVMQQLFSGQLRFKDEHGKDFPDWEEKRLAEVFKFKQGFQFAVEEQSEDPFENSVEFVRIINVTSSPNNKRYVIDPGVEFHLNEDDLFMVRYGDAGKIVTGFNGIIANNMFRLLPIVELSKKWHFFYLDYIYDKIHALAGSSTMPAIKFGTISGLRFMSPCLEEQQKIATYLSSIDFKIESVAQQMEKTKEFKNGLLQQMFVAA